MGRVIRGAEITEVEAIVARLADQDVVICDGPPRENRSFAHKIENSLGPCFRQDLHKGADPYALPHSQQLQPPPEGHTFYETAGKRAAKNP